MFFGRNIKSRFLSICWRYVVCLIAVPLSLVVFNTVAHSAQLKLAWSPNGELDLAGYNIYYTDQVSTEPHLYNGTDADQGSSPIFVEADEVKEGDICLFVVSGLSENKTYCFTLTAVDTSENESDFADPPACWTWTPPPDDVLESLLISGPDSVYENTMSNYTATATFSDRSTQPATNNSSWSEGSSYASISGSGVLTTSSVNSNQTVTIVASYT
ncbi:MAG: fibronectin type III domain-containing protein, partial [Deltaproteobacteria bacterium]|nr:fibronectin type III domain-containing protein [Deltaproteobacteria bacterium]